MEAKLVLAFMIMLVSIFDLSTSTDIVCDYKQLVVYFNFKKYGCLLSNKPNISNPEQVNISSATGTHSNGKTNLHVQLFYSEYNGIEYFPQGLEKIYPNIIAIVIKNSSMKEIRASDLKSYWKIAYLRLSSNLIEVVEDGTFDHITELKYLSFYGDKIIQVGLNVFNNLIRLTTLSFTKNVCIDAVAENSTVKVHDLIKRVKLHCRDFDFIKLDGRVKSLDSDSKHLNRENFNTFEQSLENLEFEIQNSRFSYLSSFKARIQDLKNKKSELKLSLNGNFENVTKRNEIQVIDDKLKINVYERFEKIEKDLETSHMYILKAVDIKMKEFESRLIEKLQEVLLQNVGTILKAMDGGSDNATVAAKNNN